MTDKTSTEILENGLRRLEEDGWVQRMFGGPNHGWCALGAIESWNMQYPSTREARRRLAWATLGNRETDDCHVAMWNDAEDRTKEDVILAFKKAIHDE